MCNVEKNEFFEFTNSTISSLKFMNKLVEKIEKHSDKDIESVQCIESLRDNIDILKKQIEEIKERFILLHMNMHMSNFKLFTEAFLERAYVLDRWIFCLQCGKCFRKNVARIY